MRLPTVTDLRRLCGDELLTTLEQMAYTGSFDCEALDKISASAPRRWMDKGAYYYIASLYLQLGEADRASNILRLAGRPSAEMKYFCMVLQHSKTTGLSLPKLDQRESQCLQYLQQRYTDMMSTADAELTNTELTGKGATGLGVDIGLQNLFSVADHFAVVGNAPLDPAPLDPAPIAHAPGHAPTNSTTDDSRIVLAADCASVCFNNYSINPRIDGIASIHVVTPSWHFAPPHPEQHLVITGNSVFYRRSRVWRKFMDCPPCAGIHTMPRLLWSGLVDELQASPSAGLLFLAFLDSYCDLSDKHGLIAGFSNSVPTQNHSYDEVPLSDRHDWPREILKRQRVVQGLKEKTRSLKIE